MSDCRRRSETVPTSAHASLGYVFHTETQNRRQKTCFRHIARFQEQFVPSRARCSGVVSSDISHKALPAPEVEVG